jgi:hypothetical protein
VRGQIWPAGAYLVALELPQDRPYLAWDGPRPVRAGSGLVYIGPAAGKTGAWTQNRDTWESSSRPRAHPAFGVMERRAMRSSSVPDPEGFGDHPDQYAGDPVRRLRVPGAGAAPRQDGRRSRSPGPQQALAEVRAGGRPPRV